MFFQVVEARPLDGWACMNAHTLRLYHLVTFLQGIWEPNVEYADGDYVVEQQ